MLIGIAGPAGVGKTSIARQFEKEEGFMIMSYAQPLKAALTALTGFPMEFFTDIKLKETPLEFGKSPREMMQLMGTEFVREMISEDFWTWRMRQRIESLPTANIVIDDIRFDNEAQLVRDMGGTILHPHRNYKKVTDHNEHRSEQEILTFPEDLYFDCEPYTEEETFSIIWNSLLYYEKV